MRSSKKRLVAACLTVLAAAVTPIALSTGSASATSDTGVSSLAVPTSAGHLTQGKIHYLLPRGHASTAAAASPGNNLVYGGGTGAGQHLDHARRLPRVLGLAVVDNRPLRDLPHQLPAAASTAPVTTGPRSASSTARASRPATVTCPTRRPARRAPQRVAAQGRLVRQRFAGRPGDRGRPQRPVGRPDGAPKPSARPRTSATPPRAPNTADAVRRSRCRRGSSRPARATTAPTTPR